MTNLGAMLLLGDGVAASRREAASWYRRAWRLSRDGLAALNLGLLFEPKNRKAAIRWFRRAVERGTAPALTRLAWLLSSGRGRSPREAVRLYLRADRIGELNPIGLYNLALAFEFGPGVKKNLPRAMRLYRRSAKLGWVDAQVALGFNFLRGIGVRRDVAKARHWYGAAASQGDLSGHFSLGQIHADDGATKKALPHLRFAARRGHVRARKLLEQLRRDGG